MITIGLGGCASLYFDEAQPPAREVRHTLDSLPEREHWIGIVFNGNKIGFSHLRIEPVANEAALFDLRAEAALRFRLLTLDKRITLKSIDRIDDRLRLRNFEYEHDLDGNRLLQSGRVEGETLLVELETGGQITVEQHPLDGPLYPTSIINLYPILQGLEVGRIYEYRVYDGETRSVATVRQEVVGYESSKLFDGEAFKLRTALHGQSVTTWLDRRGRPVLEISMNGVLIAGLESEDRAQRYLAQAALNKSEAIIEFSLIRPERRIDAPRNVVAMTVRVSGLPPSLSPPSDGLQHCRLERAEWVCTVGADARAESAHRATEAERRRYLAPSFVAPSGNPVIQAHAAEAAGDFGSEHEVASSIVSWMRAHVAIEAVDVFTALDVLERGRAECQGHSYLYAAMARARGLPTRVVNGIVYSEQFDGFLYHTWAESLISGRWYPVDPTFGQIPADATHLKLIEGESLAELAPMLDAVGRIEVEVQEVRHAALQVRSDAYDSSKSSAAELMQ